MNPLTTMSLKSGRKQLGKPCVHTGEHSKFFIGALAGKILLITL